MSYVDQKLNPKWKAYDSPENSYIQIKCKFAYFPLCMLEPLPLPVPTDAVNSLIVTTIQSHAEIFKATL